MELMDTATGFTYRLKKRIRAWLDIESLEDANVRRKYLHSRVDMISQNTAELLAIVQRQAAECLKTNRYCTMTALAAEMERDHVELGHLPCGCLTEQEHRGDGGRGHSDVLMRRVERWLDWRKREKNPHA